MTQMSGRECRRRGTLASVESNTRVSSEFHTVKLMDELFSCRNCIHNCGQSLLIGPGSGFCLQHDSVIVDPERTTCKYLHRKDLPHFVVDEGIREHAAEFAGFPLLVALDRKVPIERVRYSEKRGWERGEFDPIVHALAQYYKVDPRWCFISAFSGGVDGRHALTHSSLVRHFMDHCSTWISSYRLVLGLVQEIDVQPRFDPRALIRSGETSDSETADEATWDVVFVRLSALQEYGWHAGLEPLMWASDTVNSSLSELDWPRLQGELKLQRGLWIKQIVSHAKAHGEFFPAPEPRLPEDDEAVE
ncbi:MAG: hypothetical protein ACHRXM_16405 [Isosphaerales bacterium]